MCLCGAAAAQQCVRQRRSRTRPVLHLPAHPCGGGRARTAAARGVCDRRLCRSVWSRLSSRLFQTQVLSVSIVLELFFLYLMFFEVTDDSEILSVQSPSVLKKKKIKYTTLLFNFLFVSSRLQMLDHFAECIKQAKGVRQQAVQLNIFTAVLSALKVSCPDWSIV